MGQAFASCDLSAIHVGVMSTLHALVLATCADRQVNIFDLTEG